MTLRLGFGLAGALALLVASCTNKNVIADTDMGMPIPDEGVATPDEGVATLDQGVLDDAGPGMRDAGISLTCDPNYTRNENWTGVLRIEEGSRLCAYAPDDQAGSSSSLPGLVRAKSEILMVPGTYPLPTATGSEAFSVPMCVVDGEGSALSLDPAMGFTVETAGGITDIRGNYVRATVSVGGEDLALNFVREPGAAEYVVSARPSEHHQLGVFGAREGRLYATCSLEPTRCTNMNIGEVGSLRVDEHLWAARGGRGFAALTRVSGTLEGEVVEVDSYAQLTTDYFRHAFSRYHFVRFDSPIATGHCGALLELGSTDPRFAWASCDGTATSEFMEVTTETVDCRG